VSLCIYVYICVCIYYVPGVAKSLRNIVVGYSNRFSIYLKIQLNRLSVYLMFYFAKSSAVRFKVTVNVKHVNYLSLGDPVLK
jgi:hypothetical protein